MGTFWLTVFEDIVANLATILVLLLSVFLFWFWRLTNREQWLRRWIHPPRRVFVVPTQEPTHWAIDQTPFVHPVRPDERQRLVDWYSQRMQTWPTNGQVVRLDGVDPWCFSTVEFFDFLTTNLTTFPANWPRATLAQHWQTWWHGWSVFPLIQRVRSITGVPQSGLETLMNRSLANPLAVSILIQDVTGRWGLTVRSRHVAIASGQWGATAAGTVSREDLRAFPRNPIIACAHRETSEELGLSFTHFAWDGLVVARQKRQPVALVSAQLHRSWEEVLPLIKHARDWAFENTALHPVSSDRIAAVIRKAPLTDAAAYHLWLHRDHR